MHPTDDVVRMVNGLAQGDPARCAVGLRAAADYEELRLAGVQPVRLTLERFVRARMLVLEGAPVEPHDLADPPAVPVEVSRDERFRMTGGDVVLEDAARRAAEEYGELCRHVPPQRLTLAQYVRAAVERTKADEAALRRTGGVTIGRAVPGENLGRR